MWATSRKAYDEYAGERFCCIGDRFDVVVGRCRQAAAAIAAAAIAAAAAVAIAAAAAAAASCSNSMQCHRRLVSTEMWLTATRSHRNLKITLPLLLHELPVACSVTATATAAIAAAAAATAAAVI